MPITKEDKAKIIKQFGGDSKNTGSTEVQIAIITQRINDSLPTSLQIQT